MLVSVRSRLPLISVVLCDVWPAMVFRIVILKSPVIVVSVCGLLCADETAERRETANMAVAKLMILFLMNGLPGSKNVGGIERANYQKLRK